MRLPQRHRHRPFGPLLAAAALTTSLLGLFPGVGSADDLPGAVQSGDLDLQGILPDFIPSGLTEEDFAELGDNWADWGRETGALVTDFYSSEDPEVRGRRGTLEQLKGRLATMTGALADPQYASVHPVLADLHGRLAPRVAVMDALLNTRELNVGDVAETQRAAALAQLASAGKSLQNYLQGVSTANEWTQWLALDDVVSSAQAGDASEAAVAQLKEIQQKLAERTAASEEVREFLSREPVLAFEDSLNRAVVAVGVKTPGDAQDRLTGLAADLLRAIEEYETEPLSEHARAIRIAYDDLRRASPDGGALLTEAMRRYYLNFNLRAVIDESLVQSLLRESRFESGMINEVIMQAEVTGCQWTNTSANVDLKPSADGLRFDIVLRGNIRASTRGDTHLASVFVAGNHYFCGMKEVCFDGDHFSTCPARVGVTANTCPTGAETHFSRLPLIGPCTEKLALSEAQKRVPEANALTRQKIYSEVKPRFDRETASNFQKAEMELETRVNGPLREQGLYPDIKHYQSTETDARVRTRLMESGELGGGHMYPIPLAPHHGVLVQVHKSLFNNAAQRMELEGKTFTPDELEAYLKDRVERVVGRPVDFGRIVPERAPADQAPGDGAAAEGDPEVESIVFADEDAVRVQIEEGTITLYLRVGLNLTDRDDIPPQSISVPLKTELREGKIWLEAGAIGVAPIAPVPPAERTLQITRANIMRSKIQKTFEPQEVDTRYTLSLDRKELTLIVTTLQAHGGWLNLLLTDGVSEQPTAARNGQTLTR
jgi:hypothetical protein